MSMRLSDPGVSLSFRFSRRARPCKARTKIHLLACMPCSLLKWQQALNALQITQQSQQGI
jgi:hypothetical protein